VCGSRIFHSFAKDGLVNLSTKQNSAPREEEYQLWLQNQFDNFIQYLLWWIKSGTEATRAAATRLLLEVKSTLSIILAEI